MNVRMATLWSSKRKLKCVYLPVHAEEGAGITEKQNAFFGAGVIECSGGNAGEGVTPALPHTCCVRAVSVARLQGVSGMPLQCH
jgi:hypothetical protein